MKPIKIVGAGISGLTAAINLAKAGYPVTVYEKRRAVGARFDGDYQYIENWSTEQVLHDWLVEINIVPDFILAPGGKAIGIHAYGLRHEYDAGQAVFYLVRRGSDDDCLDTSLLKQCISAGATVKLGEKLPPEDADIIATGPGLSLILLRGVAFETDCRDLVQVIFDNEIAPRFYAYMIAFSGRAVICAARIRGTRRNRNYLKHAIEKFRESVPFEMRNERYFGNLGVSRLRLGGKIRTGEAAGFQDRLWGFGMRYAFHSGYLAAKAIIENRDYWELVRREIMPHVRASTVGRWVMYSCGNLGTWLFLQSAKRVKDYRRWFRTLCSPRWAKDLLFPLAEAHINSLLVPRRS